MKFLLGNVPEPVEFTPDSPWQPFGIQEKSIWKWQFKALPIALLNMMFVFLIWLLFTPVMDLLKTVSFPLPIQGFLLCLIGVLAVHELIHASVHPQFGFSSNTILGFWLSRMLLYAMYDGTLFRNRFITILIMPFIIIASFRYLSPR